MAIVAMADAVEDAVASSAEYNKLIDNIEDLDSRQKFYEDSASLKAFRTTPQTMAASLPTTISWQDTEDDALGFYSAGNPTQLIARQDGKYNVCVHLSWESVGTGVRWVFCTKNSTDTTNDTFLFAGNNNQGLIATGSIDESFVVGDVIRVYGYHSNTEDIDLVTTFGGTKITLRRVGP